MVFDSSGDIYSNSDILCRIRNTVSSIISRNIDCGKDISDSEIRELITNAVFDISGEFYFSINEKHEIVETVFNSMRRLGAIQPFIDDESVTEIMVNGPGNIFIEKGGKIYKSDVRFESTEKLEDVIQSVVSKANRVVNEASPIVDARLKDGSRVNVVLKPIAVNGPVMTIRKFPQKPLTMEQLIKWNSITIEAADFLGNLVKARYNIFVCGGTGSGKTTFLNALSNFISGDERIITIEDSAELQIKGIQNLISLETRNGNMEGRGKIGIRELIRTSLRMRPERIIVGEVRGEEALDMLQAMNTGHEGSLSTGHGNSSKDMLSRLETMVLSAAPLPLTAIRQQIASAIDVIVHLARMRDKTRKTVEITEVSGFKNGEIVLNPLFVFSDEGDTEDGKVKGSLVKTENKMVKTAKFHTAGMHY
ncbi:MAG TPA: CpaF family protein [Clostridiales bacterium]|nr:CpaF family protein [Clostridiales bacterium]